MWKTLNPSANSSDYGLISRGNAFCRWVETVVKWHPPVSVRLLSVVYETIVDRVSRGPLVYVWIWASDLAAFSIKLPCVMLWGWWDKAENWIYHLLPLPLHFARCHISPAVLHHTVGIIQQTPMWMKAWGGEVWWWIKMGFMDVWMFLCCLLYANLTVDWGRERDREQSIYEPKCVRSHTEHTNTHR